MNGSVLGFTTFTQKIHICLRVWSVLSGVIWSVDFSGLQQKRDRRYIKPGMFNAITTTLKKYFIKKSM